MKAIVKRLYNLSFLSFLTCLLVLFAVDVRAQVQQETVTGAVTEEGTGNAIPGANVVVKGTATGTSTDDQGRYELSVPSLQDTLVFSFVGYQTHEEAIQGRSTVNVSLRPAVLSQEGLVVVGYGQQQRSEVTGSVGRVGEEDLAQPSFNTLQSLKGKIPGVQIFENSGSPTGRTRVVIRGVGTINGSTDPLFIVDGVARDDISTMNPNDIQSIEVLKDASAAAIYGARGANGVVLITTKRGGEGGVDVQYSGNVGFGRISNKMDAMNAEEFMEVQRIGYQNAHLWNNYGPGEGPQFDLSDDDIFDEQGNPRYDTDWQDEATRTALSQDHQISVRFGSDNSSFGAYMNYAREEGVYLNSWLRRASLKLVYDITPAEWVSIGTNFAVEKNWGNEVTETGGGFHASRAMVEVPPIFPVKWSDGTWSNSTQIDGFTFEGQPNPVHRLLEETRRRSGTRLFGNAFVEFNLASSLKFKTQLGLDQSLSDLRYFAPSNLITVGDPDGEASITNDNTTYWQIENFLTFDDDFGNHGINTVLGSSWQQRLFRGNSISANSLPSDFFRYNNIGASSNQDPATSFASDWTINSFFGRSTYTYDDTYSVTLTGRVDGSSRFGKNNRYGFFPSAGASWLVSNEGFMQGVEFIDELRVRGSFGVVGNTEIGLFQSLATIGSSTTLIGGERAPASSVLRLPNPDLSWERTKQWDAGIEFALFSHRLSVEADYYYKLTDDLILNRPVPTSTGFGSITDNIGSVSNRGIDLSVNTRNIVTDKFLWTSSVTFNRNRNKVESLGANEEDIFPGPFWVGGSQTILRVGEPLASFWGFERLGTWNADEAEEAAEVGAIPGEAKRSSEKMIIGNGLPDFTGSLINRFEFGSFDATIDLQFSYGADILQQTLATAEDRQGLTNGIDNQLYQAWTPEDQDTPIQRIRHTVLSGQNLRIDSHWVVDGSYLRANLLSLGYSFGQGLLSTYGIGQVRVHANIENAFVIYNDDFKGFDPEISTWHGSNFGQNIAFYGFPKARTFTLGVNMQF